MLLYHVTCHVDDSIKEEWLLWMKETHLPEVLATGKFLKYKMYKLDPNDGDTGSSYAIHYFAEKRSDYEEYLRDFAPALKAETTKKYGNSVIAMRTIMEEV